MTFEPQEPVHLAPLEIAHTFLLRSAVRAFGARSRSGSTRWWCGRRASGGRHRDPLGPRGVARRRHVARRPSDLRWVFLSHDDEDHHGSLRSCSRCARRATLVTTGRHRADVRLVRGDARPDAVGCTTADALDIGDRTLRAIRPPAYESPTTRALFDPTSGVFWSSDAFATRCRRIGSTRWPPSRRRSGPTGWRCSTTTPCAPGSRSSTAAPTGRGPALP